MSKKDKIKEFDVAQPSNISDKKMVSMLLDLELVNKIDDNVAMSRLKRIPNAPRNRTEFIIESIKKNLEKE